MSVKIGEKTYATTKPGDLDAQLIEATGCNAAEFAAQMSTGTPFAGIVAAALKPFLPKDSPSVPELASDIAAAGVMDVQSQVAALYAEKPAKAAANG